MIHFKPQTIAVLFLITAFAACARDIPPTTVWGVPVAVFTRELETGAASALDRFDPESDDIGEVRHLGDGAAYYLALHAERLGRPRLAAAFLRYEAQNGTEPWRRLSHAAILGRGLESGSFVSVLESARVATRLYPDDPTMSGAYIEALYRLERYQAVIEALDEEETRHAGRAVVSSLVRDGREPRWGDERAERKLWRTVATYRLGDPLWRRHVVELFRDYDVGDVHVRVHQFLVSQQELDRGFSDVERALLDGKRALGTGAAVNAMLLLGTVIERPEFRTPALLRDLSRAYSFAAHWRQGGDAFSRLSSELTGDRAVYALEHAGRHYRVAGRFIDSLRYLEAAHAAASPDERARIARYLLMTASRLNPDVFSRAIREYGASIESPAQLYNEFDDFIARLVAGRDWGGLVSVYRALESFPGSGVRAQVAYVLSEAIASGYVGASAAGDRTALLEYAAHQTDRPYYTITASAMLGRSVSLLDFDAEELGVPTPADHPGDPVEHDPVDEAIEADRLVSELPGVWDAEVFVRGFLAFGLADQLYEHAFRYRSALRASTIFEIAEVLVAGGKYYESIRLAAAARPAGELDRRSATLLYPRAFRELIERFTEAESLPRPVFYALIREESLFSPTIASSVGATGLSQLMPATARDMATRMGITNLDVTDPETNLSIGARYLSGLMANLPGPMHALAAYNGGQGRVRSWIGSRAGFSDVLFHESIPFVETRGYIRKILVSAAYYASLYEGVETRQTVESIFPSVVGR